jgi:hypothetical protein
LAQVTVWLTAWVGCALIAGALTPEAARAQAEILFVDVTHESGTYHVTSTAVFSAPLASVYAVLADYDDLTRLSSTITESRVLSRGSDTLPPRVRTTLRGCVLFFCRSVVRVEDMFLVPGRVITTRVVPELSDFRGGFAQWTFYPLPDGRTRVDMEVRVIPGFFIPPLIGPPAVRRKLIEDGERAVERIDHYARIHAQAQGG